MFEQNSTLEAIAEPTVTFSRTGEPKHIAVEAESSLAVTQTVPVVELTDKFREEAPVDERELEHIKDALTDDYNRTDKDSWDWVGENIEDHGFHEITTRSGNTYKLNKDDFEVEAQETDPMYESGVSATVHFTVNDINTATLSGFSDVEGGVEDIPVNVLRLVPPCVEVIRDIQGIEDVAAREVIEGTLDMSENPNWKD